MSVEFAKLLAVYGADTSGFDQSAARVTGTLEKQAGVADVAFGSFFGNIMSQATGAVMGLAGEAVTSYANFERLGMSVQSLTAREMLNTGAAKTMSDAMKQAGPAAQATLGWIQKLAIQSPFTSDGVASAYRQALAYGFAGDEAKKLTQNLIDFAAGSGASEGVMNSIALALGQVKAKGHLAGGEILQLVNTGLPVLQILAKAFGKSTEEIQSMVSAGLIPADAAIKAISQSIENDFGGAAARQTKSFAGLLSSLEDIKAIGLREFFTGTFETIQPYIDQFASSMQDPATLAAIRGWGMDLGFYVGQGAQALAGFAGAWQGLGGDAQGAILKMGGLALILPTLAQITSAGFQAVTMVAGFAQAAGTAVSAWQAGLTLTTAFQVGFGATAVAVGAVTIALAALVAMWWAYNEQITKTQQQGMADNVTAWGKAFDEVKAKGGSASDVLAIYEKHVRDINAQHEAGGLIADVFVDKQQLLMNGFDATLEALKSQATSYEDYRSKSDAAARAIGLMIDANGNLVKSVQHRGGATTELVKADKLMTEGMWEAIKGGDAYNTELVKMKEGAYGGAAAVTDMGKAAIESKDILSGLSSALKDAGLNAGDIAKITDDVKVSLGDMTPAARQAQDDVALLTSAFADGILTEAGYITQMQAAKDGTLQLSDAERTSLETRVASIAASRDAEQAARDSATAYWSLAESLKGAGEAEIAREAIKGLTELMKNTKGDPADYAAAIQNIGLAYGLMDEKSLALSGALPQFNKLLSQGIIPANDAAKALAGLNQEAADGVVDWDNYLKQFGVVPAQIASTSAQIPAAAAAAMAAGGPAIQAGMNEIKTTAEDVVAQTSTVFTEHDWQADGRSVGDGMMTGFNAKIPDLTEVARGAAASFSGAFSGVDWSGLGKSMIDDITAGVTDPATIQALIDAAAAAATAGMQAAQNVIDEWLAPPVDEMQIVNELSRNDLRLRNILDTGVQQPADLGAQRETVRAQDVQQQTVEYSFIGPVTFVVENHRTLDDLMRQMRVRL